MHIQPISSSSLSHTSPTVKSISLKTIDTAAATYAITDATDTVPRLTSLENTPVRIVPAAPHTPCTLVAYRIIDLNNLIKNSTKIPPEYRQWHYDPQLTAQLLTVSQPQ